MGSAISCRTLRTAPFQHNIINLLLLTFQNHEPIRSAAYDVGVRGQCPIVGHARWYTAITGLPQRIGTGGGAGRRLRYYRTGSRLVANSLLLAIPVTVRPLTPLGQGAARTAGHVTVLPGQWFLLPQRAAECRFDRFSVIGSHARHVPVGHTMTTSGSLCRRK